MAKILVLYYSKQGHVARMAQAVATGARETGEHDVHVKRVPDPETDGRDSSTIPVAQVDELPDYDAILFGTPTRYGNMSGPMRVFLDRTVQLWMSGALIGKLASVFTASATQHGGQESTILTFHPTLLHLGMIIVGLPYSCREQMGVDEIKGGSPYGAATIAGDDGKRMPSAQELAMARFQGRHVAALAARLAASAEAPA